GAWKTTIRSKGKARLLPSCMGCSGRSGATIPVHVDQAKNTKNVAVSTEDGAVKGYGAVDQLMRGHDMPMSAIVFGVINEISSAPCGSNAFHAPRKRKHAIAQVGNLFPANGSGFSVWASSSARFCSAGL